LDANITAHVDGHVLIKYEDEDIFVDEGFIVLTGTDAFPAHLIAGRQYIPFGNFDSHFVTDPVTLVLGETNTGAAVAGYRFGGDAVEVSAGVFNGRVDEVGDDDTISSFVGAVVVSPAEGFMVGASIFNWAAQPPLIKSRSDFICTSLKAYSPGRCWPPEQF
jgi:hypothetical protein